ncbi:MAG: hypothetical protein R3Y26_01320 [Rikenellaceae bacterium]
MEDLSMVFQYKVTSEEDDNFIRIYEIDEYTTLKDFHALICQDLDYDDYEMASFFVSDENWHKYQEYTLEDMGLEPLSEEDVAPQTMEKATVSKLLIEGCSNLLFVFDIYQDRAFFVKYHGMKEAEKNESYPRVMFAHGEAPDQFDADATTGNSSIFDEAMDDWGDFDGNDDYYDED